jgi:hypothetical protein
MRWKATTRANSRAQTPRMTGAAIKKTGDLRKLKRTEKS